MPGADQTPTLQRPRRLATKAVIDRPERRVKHPLSHRTVAEVGPDTANEGKIRGISERGEESGKTSGDLRTSLRGLVLVWIEMLPLSAVREGDELKLMLASRG